MGYFKALIPKSLSFELFQLFFLQKSSHHYQDFPMGNLSHYF